MSAGAVEGTALVLAPRRDGCRAQDRTGLPGQPKRPTTPFGVVGRLGLPENPPDEQNGRCIHRGAATENRSPGDGESPTVDSTVVHGRALLLAIRGDWRDHTERSAASPEKYQESVICPPESMFSLSPGGFSPVVGGASTPGIQRFRAGPGTAAALTGPRPSPCAVFPFQGCVPAAA